MNRAQVDNVIKSTNEYADELLAGFFGKDKPAPVSPEDARRMIVTAYVSGVLSTAQVLAMNDGFHPSKLAEAARIAGEEMTGTKSVPHK